MLTNIAYSVEYEPRQLLAMKDDERIIAASVWMDRILGLMGEAPADYARFGWFAEDRSAVENILLVALALAKDTKPSRTPARIMYRFTKADTATAITAHTVTVCQTSPQRVNIEWSAEIKEMG